MVGDMVFVRALQSKFFTFLMIQNIFFAKDDYYILKSNSISEQKSDYIYSPKQNQDTPQRTTPRKPNDILFDSIYALRNTVQGIIAKNEELSMKILKQKENYEKLSLNFGSILDENKAFHEEIKKLKSITEKQTKEISELKQNLEKIIKNSQKPHQKEATKAKPQQTDKEFIESVKKLIKGRYFTKSIEMLTDFIKNSAKSIYLGQAFFYRGISYMLKSDITNASKDFVESYTKNPKSSVAKHALWFLSECLKKQGKRKESEIILQKLKLDYPKYEEEKFKF